MNIAQLAQELLDKGGSHVSVAVKVCVDKAQKARPTPPSYEEYDEDDADVEDDEPSTAPMKDKKSAKPKDGEEEEDVYVDDLDEQYEIDLEGKKKVKR